MQRDMIFFWSFNKNVLMKELIFDFIEETEEEQANDGLLDSLSRYFRKKFLYNVILTNRQSFVSLGTYMENINFLIDDIDIRDTKIPFYAVCTDLNPGSEIVLSKASLRKAVAASSAIPGFFPPIEMTWSVSQIQADYFDFLHFLLQFTLTATGV